MLVGVGGWGLLGVCGRVVGRRLWALIRSWCAATRLCGR